MCPVLAFSRYVITHPYVLGVTNEGNMIFTANSHYDQYTNIFNKVVCVNEDGCLLLVLKTVDLDSHLA